MNNLPDTPSELVAAALADLEQAEQDPRYKVDMAVWHAPNTEFCQICLAGCVMAFTLDADVDKWVDPWGFDKAVKDKLVALDYLRTGNFDGASEYLPDLVDKNLPMMKITDYSKNPEDFKRDMRTLTDTLKQNGC